MFGNGWLHVTTMKNTNPRTNPTPEQTAKAKYALLRAQIHRQIATLTQGLDDHLTKFENSGGANYAMVGDLGKVSDDLAEVARFLCLGR